MARPDLDALMSALLPFAQRMLSKHGEFYPFGAAIDRDGQVRLMAGGADTDRPLADQVIDALVAGFRQAAAEGEVRAVGLCFDARTIPPGSDEKVDSIVLELEHVDGDCVLVALPYHKGLFGRMKYGDSFAASSKPRVFSRVGDA